MTYSDKIGSIHRLHKTKIYSHSISLDWRFDQQTGNDINVPGVVSKEGCYSILQIDIDETYNSQLEDKKSDKFDKMANN